MMETDRIVIIESVDSINKDGLDTPICVIHYKMSKHSPKTNYKTVISLSFYSADFLPTGSLKVIQKCCKSFNQVCQNWHFAYLL